MELGDVMLLLLAAVVTGLVLWSIFGSSARTSNLNDHRLIALLEDEVRKIELEMETAKSLGVARDRAEFEQELQSLKKRVQKLRGLTLTSLLVTSLLAHHRPRWISPAGQSVL